VTAHFSLGVLVSRFGDEIVVEMLGVIVEGERVIEDIG